MSQYYSLVTKAGFAAEANARSLGQLVKLTEFALGDSNDSEYDPTGDETSLKNERYRGGVNDIIFDPKYPDQFTVEGVVPQNVGGFTIREAAVYTDKGELYGIAKYPPSYKTTTSSGATSELKIRIIFGAASTDTVNLTIDPSVALATKSELDSLDTSILPSPDVQVCGPNGLVTSLHDNKFGKGQILVERAVKATMFDAEGRLLEFEADEPRYTNATGLLVLPPCTNHVAFNTAKDHQSWNTDSRNTLTLESATKRVNGQGGAVLVTNTQTDVMRIHNSSASPIQYKANEKVTASCLVKSGNGGGVRFRFYGDSSSFKGDLLFKIDTPEAVNSANNPVIDSYKITKRAYGWIQLEAVFKSTVDIADLVCEFYSYEPDNIVNQTMYIDYMQFEEFPNATPPVVTGASAVTCPGDKIKFGWKNNKRFDEFTVRADVELLTKEPAFTGGADERRHIFNADGHDFDKLFFSPSGNTVNMFSSTDSSEVAHCSVGAKTQFTAIARKSKNGEMKTFVDGQLGSKTDIATTHNEPADGVHISLGSENNSRYLCGYIKLFEIYSRALSDKQCQRMRSA